MKTAILPTSPILCAVVLGVAACAVQPGGEGPAAGAPAAEEPAAGEPAAEAPAGDGGAGSSEVPAELLAEIVDHLVAKTGAERSAIEVLRAEAVTWRDGSLGCPERGMSYMQVLTAGYWVVLGHGGQEHDYRAGRGGSFLLCEQKDRAGPLESAVPGRSVDHDQL